MIPDDAWNLLMEIEGGDKLVTDAGGLTKWGISQRAYPGLDIAGLIESQARVLAENDYWRVARCDALPAHLQFPVFDSAFNQGAAAGVRFLQTALRVPVDGIPGPRTLSAAQASGPEALHRFNAVRSKAYANGAPGSWHSWFHRVSLGTWFACRQATRGEG